MAASHASSQTRVGELEREDIKVFWLCYTQENQSAKLGFSRKMATKTLNA